MQLDSIKALITIAIVLNCWCLFSLSASTSSNNSRSNFTNIKEDLEDIDECIQKVVVSYIYPQSYPPKTVQSLRDINCKNQAEGFKCLKEKSKPLPAILKRGVQSFVQTRQRHHKKYCTTNSNEPAKEFVNAMKCLVENKFDTYNKIDSKIATRLLAIKDENFNDSSLELKYLCCALMEYKKEYAEAVGPQCLSSKAINDELLESTISSEVGFICEDEDKLLTKVCPNLKPLNVSSKFVLKKGNSPSVVSLYLVATLGEKD